MTVKSILANNETWVNKKWRPVMAWVYMGICIFDFVVAPILNYIFFAKMHSTFVSWEPLTMVNGGLFHLAMGAIIGITSWQRGQEKIKRYGTPYDGQYEEDRASYRDRLSGDSSREN